MSIAPERFDRLRDYFEDDVLLNFVAHMSGIVGSVMAAIGVQARG